LIIKQKKTLHALQQKELRVKQTFNEEKPLLGITQGDKENFHLAV
jgi:hypothetical protein